MAEVTEAEYETYLDDLRDRLKSYLDSGAGDRDRLLKDAEKVLELKDEHPQAFQRHKEVEGLVAELLARRQQQMFAQSMVCREQPGCIGSWLSMFRRRK